MRPAEKILSVIGIRYQPASVNRNGGSWTKLAVVVLIVFFFSACDKRPDRQGPSSSEYVAFLLDGNTQVDFQLFAPATVSAFYDIHDNGLVWSTETKVSKKAEELIDVIRNAQAYGLFPNEYHLEKIKNINRDSLNTYEAAKLDILLSDGYIHLAWNLKHGRLNRKTLLPSGINGTDTVLIISLYNALNKVSLADELATHEPTHPFYNAFKTRLGVLLQENDSVYLANIASRETEMYELLANLERWRWEFGAFPEEYLFINIPSYHAYVYRHDSVVFDSKVIVGDVNHPTPSLNSVIECFITYPFWHVPYSIASKELLPQFKKDPSLVERQNYQVFEKGKLVDPATITWSRYSAKNFPFTLRQREGTDNALGVIKFVFDNPYGVYVHDTNAKNLFNREKRALSHGCIRLEKAKDLALYLVRNDSARYPAERIEQWLSTRVRKEVSVRNPMPLFVRYYTFDQGKTWPDIYHRDTKIREAIRTSLYKTWYMDPLTAQASPALPGRAPGSPHGSDQ
jgi:L,D-transpeptidase YcbB